LFDDILMILLVWNHASKNQEFFIKQQTKTKQKTNKYQVGDRTTCTSNNKKVVCLSKRTIATAYTTGGRG